MSIVGLDLAGVESQPTGFCILRSMKAETCLVYGDDDILKNVRTAIPGLVAIDAPLSLPTGRQNIEQRTKVHLRECDKELLRRGIKFFPVTLGPIRKLTSRGLRLRKILEKDGFRVIEVYPGGAQDVLGIPRKQRDLGRLRVGLERMGVKALHEGMSDHELDAVTCAFVARLFLEGKAEVYGTTEQGMVMPKAQEPKEKKPMRTPRNDDGRK